MTSVRPGPADPIDVMAFNWLPFVLGPATALSGAVLLISTNLPVVADALIAAGSIGAATISAAAIGTVIWVFGIALERARSRFRPLGETATAGTLATTIGERSYGAVFFLMAAHEGHGTDRSDVFAAIGQALSPDGRLIIVEHLRDGLNTLAFGPGALHFQPRSAWLAAAAAIDLRVIEERRLSPFVRGFVFARAAR